VPDAIFAVTQTAAGAGQWISISYVVGGGAADGGMRVDGTQHASLKASPPHTCHLAHQTHVMIGRWAAVLRSRCSVRRSISVSLRWPLISFTRYKVTRRCYIINAHACDCHVRDCSLLTDRWPTSPFQAPHPNSTSRLPAQSLSADDCSDTRGVHGVQQSIPWRRRHGCTRSGLEFSHGMQNSSRPGT